MYNKNPFYLYSLIEGYYTKEKEVYMDIWQRFTEEERQAMQKIIPITQDIFDSIMKKREEIGEAADEIIMQLMSKYPCLLENNVRRKYAEWGFNIDNDFPEEEIDEEYLRVSCENLIKIWEERQESKRNTKRIQYVL